MTWIKRLMVKVRFKFWRVIFLILLELSLALGGLAFPEYSNEIICFNLIYIGWCTSQRVKSQTRALDAPEVIEDVTKKDATGVRIPEASSTDSGEDE